MSKEEEEEERRTIDLYYKQGKTFREIKRRSFTDNYNKSKYFNLNYIKEDACSLIILL
jgi:hypothetical protein